MSEILVVYWSGTGNTAAMAELVAKGIAEAGRESRILPVEAVTAGMLADCPVFALGCPSMGDEVLEESEMEPFVESLEGSVSGKKIGLFGSYGWGDGEWMRNWTERMKAAGASVYGGEDAICNGAPDEAAQTALLALGRQLAGLEG